MLSLIVQNLMGEGSEPPVVVNEKRLQLQASVSGIYPRARTIQTYTGDLDATFTMKFVSQLNGVPEVYQAPAFVFGADDSLNTSGANFIQFMTIGTQIFSADGTIEESYDAGDSWAIGTQYTVRVTVVGTTITLYKDGVAIMSLTDAGITTSGYFGFACLECTAEFDSLTGTIVDDFEAATLGTITGDTDFSNMHFLGAPTGHAVIESTGNRFLQITNRAMHIAGGEVGMLAHRKLAVEGNAMHVDGSDIGMRANRILPVESKTMHLTGRDITFLRHRIMEVAGKAMQFDGGTVNFSVNRVLTVEPRAMRYSGSDIDLRYNRYLAVDTKAMYYAGLNIDLRASRILSVEPRAMRYTGGDVGLYAHRKLTVQPSAIQYAGKVVTLLYSRYLTVEPAAMHCTGGDIGMYAHRRLPVSNGAMEYAGSNIHMDYAGQRVLQIETGRMYLRGGTITLTTNAYVDMPDTGGEVITLARRRSNR